MPWPNESGAGSVRSVAELVGLIEDGLVAVGHGKYDKGRFAGVDSHVAEHVVVGGGTQPRVRGRRGDSIPGRAETAGC